MSNQKIVTEAALSAIASDIKTALSGKANNNDVYLKSQTYNRTEIDNALALKADKSELYNVYPTEQESGAVASFTDGADNIPVKSLTSEIVAVESGNGQPKSPTNPYTISGFSSGVVTRCGKNLFSNIISEYRQPENYFVKDVPLEIGKTYTLKAKLKGTAMSGCYVAVVDKGEQYSEFTTRIPCITSEGTALTQTFTPNDTWTSPKLAIYSRTEQFNSLFENYEIQLEQGDTATPYEAYNGNTYTFTFGQTVYGGHFDNKGNLVVTHKEIDLSTLSWSATTLGIQNVWRTSLPNDCKGYADNFVPTNILCEQYEPSSVDNMYSGYSGISLRASGNYIYCSRTDLNEPQGKLIAELATPITLAITTQDIPTLLGENNIFSNCGDVEVDYHADIGLYIDKKISSLAQG